MSTLGSILDNDIIAPITDAVSSKERLEEYNSRIHMKLYPLGLYFGFLEGIALTILVIVRFFQYGLNDPYQIEVAGKGQTSVLVGYLALTQSFVFWAGIRAKSANDFSEQTRFLTFLRVYLQLLLVIWLFLFLGFWAIKDATSGTLIFFVTIEFANLLIFGGLYLSGYRFNAFLKKNEDYPMRLEYGSSSNTDLIKEFLQETSTKLYHCMLYVMQIDCLAITAYLVILICSIGITSDPTSFRANEDAVRISGFFVGASSTLTMFVGIRAIRTLDDREQYRFTTFLRVLLELMSVLFVFFCIIALTFQVQLEYYMLIGLGVHLIVFCFLYYKARELERLLSSKRRNQLKEEYFRFNNNNNS